MSERRTGDERRKTTPWFRLDAAFMANDKIVDLGADHGAAGPLVFVALMGAAKLQDDGGRARMGWTQLARHAFLTENAQARGIVACCAELGLIEVLDESPRAFVYRIVGWGDFQRPADPGAAARMRANRARKKTEEQVFSRDGDRCTFCGSPDALQIDHVLPLVRGGSDDLENLQTLCEGCNKSKKDRDRPTDAYAKRIGVGQPAGNFREPERAPNVRERDGTPSEPVAGYGTTGTKTRTEDNTVPAASGRAAEAAALKAHGITDPVPVEFDGFPAVLAVAQDAARQDRSILVHDMALLSAMRAKPGAPHTEAANLAAADLLSGRRSTRHFHVAFADRCGDLERGASGRTTTTPGAPRSSVDDDVARYLAQAEQFAAEEAKHDSL